MSGLDEKKGRRSNYEHNTEPISKKGNTKGMAVNSKWGIIRVIVPFSIWQIILQVVPALLTKFVPPDQWFFALNFAPNQPAAFVPEVVWPFLYFTLATYGWYISYELKKPGYQVAMLFLIIHMVLCWMYAPVMFAWKSTAGALVT